MMRWGAQLGVRAPLGERGARGARGPQAKYSLLKGEKVCGKEDRQVSTSYPCSGMAYLGGSLDGPFDHEAIPNPFLLGIYPFLPSRVRRALSRVFCLGGVLNGQPLGINRRGFKASHRTS